MPIDCEKRTRSRCDVSRVQQPPFWSICRSVIRQIVTRLPTQRAFHSPNEIRRPVISRNDRAQGKKPHLPGRFSTLVALDLIARFYGHIHLMLGHDHQQADGRHQKAVYGKGWRRTERRFAIDVSFEERQRTRFSRMRRVCDDILRPPLLLYLSSPITCGYLTVFTSVVRRT